MKKQLKLAAEMISNARGEEQMKLLAEAFKKWDEEEVVAAVNEYRAKV